MKKAIGYTALVVGILDLFVMMFLIVTDSALGDGGFRPITAFCFILWFVCVFTVIFCLAGTVIRFIGKSFGNGMNEQVRAQGSVKYCPQCGKELNGAAVFCPHCGTKL